ncbi:MAG: hypothetical protein DRP01_11120 [Archaeoglobales archaeon]|nr:MAG: hypothetical protein DRP01_11120 [Archaeoglobales archaeon]
MSEELEELEELAERVPQTTLFLLYGEALPYLLLFSAFISVIDICNEISKVIEREEMRECMKKRSLK